MKTISLLLYVSFKVSAGLVFFGAGLVMESKQEYVYYEWLFFFASTVFDFWITKNVAMRYLSGLHWKFDHDDKGKQTIVFRFSRYFSQINAWENAFFWNVLVIGICGWTGVALIELAFQGSPAKVIQALFAAALLFINFIGAFRCKTMKDKYKSYTETGMAQVFINRLEAK